MRSRGRPDIAWQRLIDLLKGGIDQKLNELIEVGVADETAEVIRIDADAAQLLSRLERISQIHAALAILATLALVVLLLQGLRAPLAELMRGTGKLAEGDLSHRIAISGRDEFADLGQSFNRMAGDLQAHQKALQDAHANLETLVEERTEELRQANESLAADRRDATRLLRRYQPRAAHAADHHSRRGRDRAARRQQAGRRIQALDRAHRRAGEASLRAG